MQNESYVFFKEGNNQHPVGASGVELTPFTSLAIDNRFIPYGIPIWLETLLPVDPKNNHFNKLMIAQDTGTAIKGAVRGDIFFGRGKEAEFLAGNMNSKGNYYIFIPKNIAERFDSMEIE